MSIAPSPLPILLAELTAVSVERISPSFVRVVLAGAELADLGIDGPSYDQRIKLVFPAEGHPLPSLADADEGWLTSWRDRPVEERGHMRTYTVREVRGSGIDTQLVVDFVVHEDGLAGPGARWGLQARPGSRVQVVAPRRGVPFGGVEFDPGAQPSLLLAGDESAVPAIARILEDLPEGASGQAYLEVPHAEDFQDLRTPTGMTVNWMARHDDEVGTMLVPAVREYVGLTPATLERPDDIDPDLWETPTWSSSGEDIESRPILLGHELEDLYAWIAGESAMVTCLRRALVREVGVDRRQVAFMGYWRRGVAMKS